MMARQGRYIPGIRVSKADLAHIFGVESRMVDIWLCKGLPYLQKPRPKMNEPPDEREWVFDTAEAIEWCVSSNRIDNDW